MDKEKTTDVIYLHFCNASGIDSHHILISKLENYEFEELTIRWISNQLEDHYQNVVVNGSMSRWRLVMRGVPQGSILGSVLFNIFIGDTDDGNKSTLSKFGDDTKLSGAIDKSEVRDTIHTDIDKLERCAPVSPIRFNKAKDRDNPRYVYRLGEIVLESSSAEKDLGVFVDEKVNMSQQCALAASKTSGILTSIRRRVSKMARIVALYSALMRLQPEYCVQVWDPHCRKDVEHLESVKRRATKMTQGLEHLSYEDRLKGLVLFSLEKRMLLRDLSAAFQYLKEIYKLERNQLLTWVDSDETKGNGFELKEERFRFDVRGRYFFY